MQQITLTTPNGETEISIGEKLSGRLRKIKPTPLLLVDEHVLCQHHDIFHRYRCITIPSGEKYKTLQTVEMIYRELVKLDADRQTLLVGVGGGLATDVTGFVASTFLREVPFGFISTTLLGQVDASIGGKNGVNLDGYKNMIGTIRQPGFVWCDLSLLHTLARRQYVSGIAEVIKYGAIRDESMLYYLNDHMDALLKMDLNVLEKVVSVSAGIKVDVVQKDEKESDLRRILNYGHTLGHAIERENKVLHGEAVSLGMVFATELSQREGMLETPEVKLITGLLQQAGLPVRGEADPEKIYRNILKDKKRRGKDIHFVLLEKLGKPTIRRYTLSEFKTILHDLC